MTAELEVGDIRVAYAEAGAGEQAVLIHGIGQDHTAWAQQQRELGEIATLAYDLRGHGGTTLGHADGTLAQLGRDLVGLLEQRGPSSCVGFSLGGAVALWAAAERPDLVERVIAIATSSIVGSRAAAELTRRIERVETDGAAAVRDLLDHDTRTQLASGFGAADRVVAERIAAVRDPRGFLNALRAVRGMSDRSLHDRLARLRRPVLVVAAEHDAVCPPRAAEIMLDALPAARFELVPGARHLFGYGDPGALSRTIRDGLAASLDG